MHATVGRLREWIGGVGLLLFFSAIANAQTVKDKAPVVPERPITGGAIVLDRAAGIEPSEYWIGLDCRPADTILRMHLKLEEGTGILVEGVAPESPAARAGLQQYDLLLKAGDSTLADIQGLIDAVEKAKEGVLTLKLLRKGEPLSIDVEPEKRPETARTTPPAFDPYLRNMDALRKLIEENEDATQGTMRFRLLHPGVILPSESGQVGPDESKQSPTVKSSEDSIEQRLEKMSRQIEKLQQSLDRLADQAANSDAAAEKPKKDAGK